MKKLLFVIFIMMSLTSAYSRDHRRRDHRDHRDHRDRQHRNHYRALNYRQGALYSQRGFRNEMCGPCRMRYNPWGYSTGGARDCTYNEWNSWYGMSWGNYYDGYSWTRQQMNTQWYSFKVVSFQKACYCNAYQCDN